VTGGLIAVNIQLKDQKTKRSIIWSISVPCKPCNVTPKPGNCIINLELHCHPMHVVRCRRRHFHLIQSEIATNLKHISFSALERMALGQEGHVATASGKIMGVWQGVAMDFMKFHPGPQRPTLLSPRDRPLMKRPYGRFRCSPLARPAACGRLMPL
jgi:hypothetical protein